MSKEHDSSAGSSERRQEERYRLSFGANPQLSPCLCFPFDSRRYRIRDVSQTGLCFETPEPLQEEYLTQEVNARVDIDGRTNEVLIEPVNIRSTHVGCRILQAPADWAQQLEQLLNPLRIGAQIKAVATERPDLAQEGQQVRWYRAPFACDLFVWFVADGTPVMARMFTRERVVEWSVAQGLRTGVITHFVDFNVGAEDGVLSSCDYDLQADATLLLHVQRILDASDLPILICQLFM